MSKNHTMLTILLFSAFFISAMAPSHVSAQPAEAENGRKGTKKTSYRFSYTPTYQFTADLDNGGDFDVQRHFLRFDTSRSFDKHWTVGLGLSFDYERWNFSNTATIPSTGLWDEIFRPGISIPIFYSTESNWRFAIIPSINFSGATGAEVSESLSYGTVLSAAYSFGPNLMLGLGAGIFERLDESEIFPYVVINWKINKQLRLTNPFRAGAVGPAGLELVYTPTESWELGIGGAYRSYRFRLDDSSAVADGIGDMNFWAPFLRVGWKINSTYRIDLNSGLLLDGNITIEDENGNELGETDYSTAPFVGLTLKGRF